MKHYITSEGKLSYTIKDFNYYSREGLERTVNAMLYKYSNYDNLPKSIVRYYQKKRRQEDD